MENKEFLLGLYRTMLRIRCCEESLVEPILSGEIKTPCHLYSGQEAVATGVCAALTKEDAIFGNHRSHGHFLAKGGDMAEMLAEIFCKGKGCSRGLGGSMHLVAPDCGMLGSAPIVSGTISLAAGAAFAFAVRQERHVAVSFFGDGATGEGVLYETMNFAALNQLPILFVCENNLYATHMPNRECRPNVPIFEIARPFGIEAAQVDGNDVLAVHRVAGDAALRCREGKGPFFLECLTYRLRGHVGPDDNIQGGHTDIRPRDEVDQWKGKDPIRRFEYYLLENGVCDASKLDAIRRDVQCQVEEALRWARSSEFPKAEDLDRYVFQE